MKMWLDDIRPPWEHGRIGWTWVKTAAEAIECLRSGQITEASLDHDLKIEHYPWSGTPMEKMTDTGYDVVEWMEKNKVWPEEGVHVHSLNPAGAERMMRVILRNHHGNREPAIIGS